MVSANSQGRLPRDALWEEREAAFEEMVRDVLAGLRQAGRLSRVILSAGYASSRPAVTAAARRASSPQ